MQFSISTVVLAFAGLAAAMPTENANNAVASQNGAPRFKVPDNMTVQQAQAKCGDKAQLSCCNKATYAGDTTNINAGILSGALSNLVGAGSGAAGLGIFDQCSKLDAQGKLPILSKPSRFPLTHPQSLSLESPFRTHSTRSASRTSPAARTLPPAPARTLSVPAFLALPSAPFCKHFAWQPLKIAWRKKLQEPLGIPLSFLVRSFI